MITGDFGQIKPHSQTSACKSEKVKHQIIRAQEIRPKLRPVGNYMFTQLDECISRSA
jgi:hypothetical protein